MPEEKQDLEQAVSDWLAKEGYRLEYLTCKAFRDAGIRAVLSHYVDSAEGKPREIDVSAFQDLGRRNPTILVPVLCECKYSANNPWVLLASGLSSELFADWYSIPRASHLQRLSHRIHEYEEDLKDCWHFAKGQHFAHSLVQAFRKDNRDAAFDSLQKIANAAWDCVETPEKRGGLAHLVAIPCLVVEAPLFFAWFDSSANRFVTKQVPYGRLSWTGCRAGTVVDVIHVSALNDYAQAIKAAFQRILGVLEDLVEGN